LRRMRPPATSGRAHRRSSSAPASRSATSERRFEIGTDRLSRYRSWTMRAGHRFQIVSLLVLVSAPPVWLACGGGEQKPAESAADESSSGSSESKSTAAESAAPAETESAAPEKAEK